MISIHMNNGDIFRTKDLPPQTDNEQWIAIYGWRNVGLSHLEKYGKPRLFSLVVNSISCICHNTTKPTESETP